MNKSLKLTVRSFSGPKPRFISSTMHESLAIHDDFDFNEPYRGPVRLKIRKGVDPAYKIERLGNMTIPDRADDPNSLEADRERKLTKKIFEKPFIPKPLVSGKPVLPPGFEPKGFNINEDGEIDQDTGDPWAVGPWNGGAPSLSYIIEEGADSKTVIQKVKKDLLEGTIDDLEENRYFYKKSRRLFNRRLYVRRMGWVENNAYLTKTAKQQKEARDASKDAKRLVSTGCYIPVVFDHKGKLYSSETGVSRSYERTATSTRSRANLGGGGGESTQKKKKKMKKF